MLKRRLISFGDSWPRGSELLPGEKTFGELLSQKLGCEEFSNYSHPASSINHLLVQFKSHLHRLSAQQLDPSEWMAVFFLTDQNRGCTAHNGQWIFQNATGGYGGPGSDRHLLDTVNDHYWKYIHSPELTDVTTNSTIIALQSMCKKYHMDDYYITGWHAFDFWPEVDVDKIYTRGKITSADLIESHKAPGGHPNQHGHQLIADALFSWISDRAR